MFRGRRGKKGPTRFCTANSLTIFVPHFQYLSLAFLCNGEQAEQILQHAQQWSERSVRPVDLLHSSNNYLNLRIKTDSVTVGVDAAAYVWFIWKKYLHKPQTIVPSLFSPLLVSLPPCQYTQ